MTPAAQRAFFRLAADWLICQKILIGDPAYAPPGQTYSLIEWQTGQLATGVEMHLELREATHAD